MAPQRSNFPLRVALAYTPPQYPVLSAPCKPPHPHPHPHPPPCSASPLSPFSPLLRPSSLLRTPPPPLPLPLMLLAPLALASSTAPPLPLPLRAALPSQSSFLERGDTQLCVGLLDVTFPLNHTDINNFQHRLCMCLH